MPHTTLNKAQEVQRQVEELRMNFEYLQYLLRHRGKSRKSTSHGLPSKIFQILGTAVLILFLHSYIHI